MSLTNMLDNEVKRNEHEMDCDGFMDTTGDVEKTPEIVTEILDNLKKILEKYLVDARKLSMLRNENWFNFKQYCVNWFGLENFSKTDMYMLTLCMFDSFIEKHASQEDVAKQVVQLYKDVYMRETWSKEFYISSLTSDTTLFIQNFIPEVLKYCGALLYVNKSRITSGDMLNALKEATERLLTF